MKVPAGVFLERRGTCPVAPGLEDFRLSMIGGEGDEEEQGEKPRDSKAAGAVVKAATSAALKHIAPLTPTGGLIRRFTVNGFELAHHGSVNDAVFSPSEARVATAGGDTLIKIWDPRDGSYVNRLSGHSSEVLAVRYSSSEQFLVSSGADSEILIWSMLSNQVTRRLLGHVDCVYG